MMKRIKTNKILYKMEVNTLWDIKNKRLWIYSTDGYQDPWNIVPQAMGLYTFIKDNEKAFVFQFNTYVPGFHIL